MSKGKYKHKREHRQAHVQEAQPDASLIERKQQTENSNATQPAGQDKQEPSMRPWERFFKLWGECSLTDRIIAIFTGVLALASIYQFVILNGQLDVMQKDQRAWIDISDVKSERDIGKPVVLNFEVKNTGKTPTKKFESAFVLEILNSDQSPTFDHSDKKLKAVRFSGHAVFPNQGLPLGLTSLVLAGTDAQPQPVILTQAMADKFDAGQIWFAADGEISYRDVFGNDHRMTVCRMSYAIRPGVVTTPPVGAQRCAEYNNGD